ncbi:Disease resistance protein [Corchorus olitorius]|uniref:Disease resistance protein n=1 Tax=Corchorus olitorius TaxID=93759 RepID=A0A1R3JMH3_9ROSI|nr:Disease resistance protein [Corchorus olitorius]
MAEVIASIILEHFTSLAIEKASEAWSLVRDVKKEVKRLESNFRHLRSEVAVAEEKQYLEEDVKDWLDQYKEVAYDMEDVLEDWKIALHKLQSTRGGGASSFAKCWNWEVPSFLSCFSHGTHVVKRYDIGSRIVEIYQKVDQIVEDKKRFDFTKREINKQPQQDTNTFVDVSRLHGRDNIKRDIIKSLLSEDGTSEEVISCNNIPVIAIVGMTGIGKSALAQLVYNDTNIQTYFQPKIWVPVSHAFDQIQIALAILGVLDPNSNYAQNPNLILQPLLVEIREKIEGKRFFLVLDDMKIERAQDWEPFEVAFRSGMSGSRILVTTRKGTTAKKMAKRSCIFQLGQLPKETCWLIIKQVAFSGRNKIKGIEDLEEIGMKIAKKCKGLPLVAKTLGSVLQERLRSLGVDFNSESHVSVEALRNLFSVSKRLRLLEFGFAWALMVKEIPDEIGNLIHLRYLGLQRSRIKKLPESICKNCYLLETLDLRRCYHLEKLPDGIGKLKNLRHLYTEGCISLTYYPKGIGELKWLVRLTDIIARVDGNDTNEFSFGDLEKLNLLHEHVFVELVGVNAIDMKEVNRAKLHNKKYLKELYVTSMDSKVEEDVIVQALDPPSNLQVKFGDMREETDVILMEAMLLFLDAMLSSSEDEE